jgi:hypothetical protein
MKVIYRMVVAGMLASVALGAVASFAATVPSRTYATIPAAKDVCISWTYAENRKGIFSTPQITFVNKCAREVRAYICTATVYNPSAQFCSPKSGGYWSRTFPAQSTFVVSTMSGGTQNVVIRECPAGYERPATGIVSDFPCDKK